MKAGTESKLKFLGLKRQLRLPFWQVVGVLEALWHTTLRNAPDGDIGRLTNEEIAAAIEWDGDADELISALVKSRWLDADPDFRLIVHDWSEHCPNYLKGGYTNGHKSFADVVAKSRAKLPSQDTSLATELSYPAKATSSEGVATNPIQSNPIQSNPIQSNGANPAKPTGSKVFVPPTVAEVAAYCADRNNNIDPEYFVDKYEAIGWVVGKSKTKMKSWKAVIRTWEKNNFEDGRKQTSKAPANEPIVTKFPPVDILK
jgi:hypothetical protein